MATAGRGFDVSTAGGARAALTAAAERVVEAHEQERSTRELREEWRGAVGGARSLALLAGCSQREIDEEEERATALELVPFDEMRDARPTLDCSTKGKALAAVGRARRLWESAANAAQRASDAKVDGVRALEDLSAFVINAGRIAKDPAGRTVERVLARAGLDRKQLVDRPISERPIIEIVAEILARAGAPMSSAALLRELAALGRPVGGPNPPAVIRSAVLGRKNSPVKKAGRGLWMLRPTNEAAGG